MKLKITLIIISLISLCQQFNVTAQYNWAPTSAPLASSRYDDMVWRTPEAGYVIDFEGTLQKTTDGSQTWNLLQGPEGKWYRSIAFLTDQVGFIGKLQRSLNTPADTFTLYQTVNAGHPFRLLLKLLRIRAFVECLW